MAEVTEKVDIGCLVACNSYRNPNLLADMARTLDHISNGRFIFAIGSGWNERDYNEYGYELGTAASRLQDLDRDMPIIMERFKVLNPPPIRQPFPVMIGGGGEKVTLRIVAQHANIWNGQGEPEVLAHKNQVLNDWCAKVGRNPDEIERSAQIFGPQLDKLDEYYEAGITHFITDAGGPDYDLARCASSSPGETASRVNGSASGHFRSEAMLRSCPRAVAGLRCHPPCGWCLGESGTEKKRLSPPPRARRESISFCLALGEFQGSRRPNVVNLRLSGSRPCPLPMHAPWRQA
ncbi:MAG: LLM class F420-dependent oxidoreductase [Thermomicrobiales bacterium]